MGGNICFGFGHLQTLSRFSHCLPLKFSKLKNTLEGHGHLSFPVSAYITIYFDYLGKSSKETEEVMEGTLEVKVLLVFLKDKRVCIEVDILGLISLLKFLHMTTKSGQAKEISTFSNDRFQCTSINLSLSDIHMGTFGNFCALKIYYK